MRLPFANIASIIAASEKDDSHVKDLEGRLRELAVMFLRPGEAIKLSMQLPKISTVIYYLCTWAVGSRTLGEEYAGIAPVDVYSLSSPSLPTRLSYILLSSFALQKLPKWFRSLFFPLHLVLFYFDGRYSELAKRLLGIRYVSDSSQSVKKRSTELYFLAAFALANALLDIHEAIQNSMTDEPAITMTAVKECRPQERCPLCLDARKDSTITSCGHVFCWRCLANWLRRFPSCPVCRESCNLSSVYTVNI